MEEKQTEATELPGAFSLFRPSYEAVLTNAWTFLGLLLIPLATFMVAGVGGGTRDNITLEGTTALLVLAGFVIALIVSPALPYVQLQSVQGKEVSIGEALREGMKRFWRFYGLSILVGLIVIGGFLLLIVPGFFMLRRYLLAQFYLYDRNVGITEAMRLSAADSKTFSKAIWGVIGMLFLIGLIGAYRPLGIVTAILQVLYYCAPAVRYFQIKTATKGKKRITKKEAAAS
jgi:uncharacterized membrane protein